MAFHTCQNTLTSRRACRTAFLFYGTAWLTERCNADLLRQRILEAEGGDGHSVPGKAKGYSGKLSEFETGSIEDAFSNQIDVAVCVCESRKERRKSDSLHTLS